MNVIKIKYATFYFKFYKLEMYTLDFFYKQLCLELGLLNSETKIGTGVS